MGGRLTDVGDDGDAVHGLLVVTDFQNLQVDLDVGVPDTGTYSHPHSDLHAHPYAADIYVSSLNSGRCIVCTGLMAHGFRAIHFHL